MATTEGSFRISFRYYFGTKQEFDSKQCWEGVRLVDHYPPPYNHLGVQLDRNGVLSAEINEHASGGTIEYVVDDEQLTVFGPLNGTVEIEARDDLVTIRVNDQDVKRLEFPTLDRSHTLSLYVSGPGEWCPELSIVTISDLLIEELQTEP